MHDYGLYEEETPNIGDRVMVFFLGKEDSRLIEPVRKYNPKRVYIFIFGDSEDDIRDKNYEKFYPIIVDGIKEYNSGIQIINKYVRFTDYYRVCQELSKIVRDERANDKNVEIIFNCSTGSKISAAAMLDCARLWRLTPIYVYSEQYNPDAGADEPFHTGEMKIICPPVFPIQKPPHRLISALVIIYKMIIKNREEDRYPNPDDRDFVMKGELQKKLIEKGLLKVDTRKKDNVSRKNAFHMAMKQKYLGPLEKSGYIKTVKEGRSKKIYLTKEGKNVAQIFLYYNPPDL